MSDWAEDSWERGRPPVSLSLAEVNRLLGPVGPATDAEILEGGKANTNLRCRRAHGPPVVLRVHQRDPDAFHVEKAVLDLVEDRVPTPERLGEGRTAEGLPVTVMAWVDGVRPTRRMEDEPAMADPVGRSVGATLAALRDVEVPGIGLFAPDLSLARSFESIGQSFEDLVQWSLRKGRARKRLGPDGCANLRAALPEARRQLAVLDQRPGLAHGDYKSSNLLVDDEGEVVAVLDWEFACPFTPMLDVAILLRHRDRYPPAFTEGFEAGYRAAGGWLPDDWRRLSRVVDLMNLVGFLNGSAPRPRLYADVSRLVEGTVEMLSGTR